MERMKWRANYRNERGEEDEREGERERSYVLIEGTALNHSNGYRLKEGGRGGRKEEEGKDGGRRREKGK